MQDLGRSDAGQSVAIKVLGRAVELVSYALRRAAGADVPFERLLELTGWDPDLVREGLERAVPEPRVVARLAPAGFDALAVARAAATFDAVRRLHELTHRILGDIDRDVDADGGAGAPCTRRRGGPPRPLRDGLAVVAPGTRAAGAIEGRHSRMPVYVYRRRDARPQARATDHRGTPPSVRREPERRARPATVQRALQGQRVLRHGPPRIARALPDETTAAGRSAATT